MGIPRKLTTSLKRQSFVASPLFRGGDDAEKVFARHAREFHLSRGEKRQLLPASRLFIGA